MKGDFSDYKLKYIHRSAPDNTKIVSFNDIINIVHSFFTIFPDTLIPHQHILRIRFKGKTIYIKTTPEQTSEK